MVDGAMALVRDAVSQEQRGVVSREVAQQSALRTLRLFRFDGANYVWVNDTSRRMLAHPVRPELEGTDMSSYRDPDGVITQRVDHVASVMTEITAASDDQCHGIVRVGAELAQASEHTQAVAASAEEYAAASEELRSQSISLNAMVAEFRLDAHRMRTGPASPGPSTAVTTTRRISGRRAPSTVDRA